MRTLSILIPAYNEERFIGELLRKVNDLSFESLRFKKEVIVVDDCSKDQSAEIASKFPFVLIRQKTNQGKGAAVRQAIEKATGDLIVIQDADLEYEPKDLVKLLERWIQLNDRGISPVAIYGSRYLGFFKGFSPSAWCGLKHREQGVGPVIANWILSGFFSVLYQCWMTDPLTAYKMFPADFLKHLRVETHGFETDHELSAKFRKSGGVIVEVPIHYFPRTEEQGKKIKWTDGFIALWTMLRFRF